MNTYLAKTMTRMFLASSLLFLLGCTKSTINILLDRDCEKEAAGGKDTTSNSQAALITFHASIESRNMTRALSPMPKGIASLLFAYQSPSTAIEEPTESGLYVTTSVGIMTGANDYKMYLPSGIYSFYAVSNNTYSTPPQFTDGISHPLVNGVDYLWANNKLQDITSQQVSLPILYLHTATQVVFEVSDGQGLKLKQLVSATITPSASGARMSLINGNIPPATSYSAPANMGINGFLAQYTLLPLQTNTPMKLTLVVLVNDESIARTYTVSVPVPNGELKAGNSYRFSAVIGDNMISFSDVNIVNWTDVDETGKPLYPTRQ